MTEKLKYFKLFYNNVNIINSIWNTDFLKGRIASGLFFSFLDAHSFFLLRYSYAILCKIYVQRNDSQILMVFSNFNLYKMLAIFPVQISL